MTYSFSAFPVLQPVPSVTGRPTFSLSVSLQKCEPEITKKSVSSRYEEFLLAEWIVDVRTGACYFIQE